MKVHATARTNFLVKVSCVRDDVVYIWERTGIAHGLVGREGERRMSTLLTYCKNIFKVPVARRKADFGKELQVLFDVALCQHSADETCKCDSSIQIVPVWRAFLADQRGPRV